MQKMTTKLDVISTMVQFSATVRKVIYTTNTVESPNNHTPALLHPS